MGVPSSICLTRSGRGQATKASAFVCATRKGVSDGAGRLPLPPSAFVCAARKGVSDGAGRLPLPPSAFVCAACKGVSDGAGAAACDLFSVGSLLSEGREQKTNIVIRNSFPSGAASDGECLIKPSFQAPPAKASS